MKTSAVLLAISLWGAWAFAPAAVAATAPAQASDSPWLQGLVRLVQDAIAVVHAGYQRAPVLVIILSALLVLPAIAVLSLVVHRAARLAKRGADSTPEPRPDAKVPAWPAQAWLAIEGEAAGGHPIAGEMVRIGRHPDNEVWLTDTSVHRYHAVIHRTEASDFFITDLSGEEGNGVRVNGTRRSHSQLTDGDIIELGKARLTFAQRSDLTGFAALQQGRAS